MANPYFLNWQEITEQILSFLPPSWRANLSGKVLKRLIVAFALATEQLYALLARLLRLSIVATSEGVWLRSLVSAFNMETQGGAAAEVVVQFRRYQASNVSVIIPQGTKVGAANGQIYQTDSFGLLLAGSTEVSIPCTCTTIGSTGTIGAGEIINLVVNIPGVDEVTNPAPSSPGRDAESDVEIKRRLPLHIEALHRATIPATEYPIINDRDNFPEVQAFITQRNYGTPGYFRGILSDWSGCDSFRVREWVPVGNGVYWCVTGLAEIHGLVAAGWPCKRFGVYSRTIDGEEQWLGSNYVAEVEQGAWRWCHDPENRRLYARANGEDLNQYQCTIVAGVIHRALRHLESLWAANGVFIDILAPFVVDGAIELSYRLEPNYRQSTVEAALRNAAYGYVGSLAVSQEFEVEALYAQLNKVPGAGGVLVVSPTSNVTVPTDYIYRIQTLTISRRAA